MRPLFRKGTSLVLFCLVTFTVSLISVDTSSAISITRCDDAPDFSARTISGGRLTLSAMRGRPVFITFWSTWCSICQEEMAYLKELKTRHPDVTFVAVTSESKELDGEDLARVQETVQDWEIPFIVLLDRNLEILDRYNVETLPASFIVGMDGKVLLAEPQFYWASSRYIEQAMDSIYSLACN